MRTAPRLAVLLLAAIVGCAADGGQGRQLEQSGQPHLAYRWYARALAEHHGSLTAATGLRRTAAPATRYWQQQASRAAEQGNWLRAARCHLEVLRIKPDEESSIRSYRQIVEDRSRQWSQAELAARPKPGRASIGDRQPPERAVASAKRPEPAAPVTEPPPRTPARTQPPARRPKPTRHEPVSPRSPRASAGEFLMLIRVSEDDDRYPERADLRYGLAIKVKDTDDDPLEADLQVYLRGRKLQRHKHLRTNSVVNVVGQGGERCQIVVTHILDRDETVTVGLRRVR